MPTVTIGNAQKTQQSCETANVSEISELRKKANATTSGKKRNTSRLLPYGTRNRFGQTFENGAKLHASWKGM